MIKERSLLLFGFFLIFNLTVSCNRSGNNKPDQKTAVTQEQSAKPFAIVHSGEYPVWFQLTDKGPVHIETVEDSFLTCALIPWPLALHVRFYEVNNNELYLAVNRDGFIKFAVNNDSSGSLALYRFSGGNFQQYTAGGFIFYDANPMVLLYLDDRFLDSGAPVPSPRTWTFSMKSNTPFPINIPALDLFPVEDGWNVDTLRLSADGYYYYRVINRLAEQPQIRMLRSLNLAQGGNDVSLEAFQNSAMPEPETWHHSSFPLLPENFFYTGYAWLSKNLIGFWEEQQDYNIGAAGFVIIELFRN
jgi:hypothetical protein